MTDKATPSPASVDSVCELLNICCVTFAKWKELGKRGRTAEEEDTALREMRDAQENFRAEVERLAAQAAPTLLDALKSGKAILIDWPMEPSTPEEALELMDAMDAEYAKTMGKPAPDDEMAVAMRRVRHMACDLWAWQKEAMRANFTALAAAQPSQAPVVQAVQAREYPPGARLWVKKPLTVQAAQWFKNGDHPQDYAADTQGFENGELRVFTGAERKANGWEGSVVRYYRHPDVPGEKPCEQCGKPHHVHGWIDTLEQGHRVCPGDWIITGVQGERYPCKPDIFDATYESADHASSGATTQAVRMLTMEEMQLAWGAGHFDAGIDYQVRQAIAAFCAVNAGRTIPADGVIGGAA